MHTSGGRGFIRAATIFFLRAVLRHDTAEATLGGEEETAAGRRIVSAGFPVAPFFIFSRPART